MEVACSLMTVRRALSRVEPGFCRQRRFDTVSVEQVLQAGRYLQLESGMSVADLRVELPGGCTVAPAWEQRLEQTESSGEDGESGLGSRRSNCVAREGHGM